MMRGGSCAVGLAWALACSVSPLAKGDVQDAPPQPAAKPETTVWYTQFGADVLAAVHGVLLGKVVEVTPLRGTDVVRVAILEWRSGARPRALTGEALEVTLLATPDDFFVGNEQLLFLKRFENGPRFSVHNRIAKSDPDWDAKLACLDHNLALQKIERDEDRRREVRKRIYDDLESRTNWTRWHSYQELAWVKKHHPTLVTYDDREDLKKLAAASEDVKLRGAVLELLKDWGK